MLSYVHLPTYLRNHFSPWSLDWRDSPRFQGDVAKDLHPIDESGNLAIAFSGPPRKLKGRLTQRQRAHEEILRRRTNQLKRKRVTQALGLLPG
jgi:hypothetical protein